MTLTPVLHVAGVRRVLVRLAGQSQNTADAVARPLGCWRMRNDGDGLAGWRRLLVARQVAMVTAYFVGCFVAYDSAGDIADLLIPLVCLCKTFLL